MEKKIEKIALTQRKKLKNLKIKENVPEIRNLDPDKIVYNYSSRDLCDVEVKLLSRGLKFCLPSKRVKDTDVLCSFELFYCEFTNFINLDYTNKERLSTKTYFITIYMDTTSKSTKISYLKKNGMLLMIYEMIQQY